MKTSVEILKSLELFGALSAGELEKLNSLAEEVRFKAGEVVIRENKPSDSLYIIKKGCVKVTKADSELSIILGEGNPIGELSFIDKQLPSATAVAGENSTLIRIPAGAFDELVESDVKIASKVYKSFALNLCRKLRDTNEWLSTKEWLSDIEKEISGRFHL